jgi:acyl-CoA carboxylase subunit beta
MTASQLLDALLDAGSYRSWDTASADVRPDPDYAAELARARAGSGCDESVRTGEGLVGGRRVAVAVSEFGFLGGSIGVAAAERLTVAVERATAEGLPLIAAPASGGTRMQEGAVAFLQMVKITAAVAAHKAAGLPYLVYLRHPTTGGVFASWASVGHLTLAEPGALIGFLGPRVYEALTGIPIPGGVQTAENLLAHGLVDAVVPPDGLAGYLAKVLAVLAPGSAPSPVPRPPPTGTATATAALPATATAPSPAPVRVSAPVRASETSAWESVRITRRPDRPGAGDLIRAAASDIVPLRAGALILALARIGGRPCVLAGQDRTVLPHGPDMLRTAQRGMELAADLRLPLVTMIDTPGGELSPQAEQEGLAREIARCVLTLVTLPVPTVSVLLGQGTGGAALALLPADRVLAAQHAWLAPLAPEGASVIVHRDTAHAVDLAARQGIRAADLAAAEIVDHVIPETSAHQLLLDLGRLLGAELDSLAAGDDDARLARRRRRYRGLGLLRHGFSHFPTTAPPTRHRA